MKSSSRKILLLTSLLAACIADRSTSLFRLREVGSIVLPDAFDVSGFQLRGDTSAYVWSRDVVLLANLSTRVIDTVGVVPNGVIVGLRPCARGDCAEVIDAHKRLRYRVEKSSSIVADTVPLDRVVSAVSSPEGWLIAGGRKERDHLSLYAEKEKGKFSDMPVLTRQFERDNVVVPFVATGGSVTVISSVLPPFSSYELHVGKDSAEATLRPGVDFLNDPERGFMLNGDWIARPPIRVGGEGWVQSFIHSKSGDRVHVAYDITGNVRSFTRTEIPLVFVANVPTLNLLLAIRRTDRAEIVMYSHE